MFGNFLECIRGRFLCRWSAQKNLSRLLSRKRNSFSYFFFPQEKNVWGKRTWVRGEYECPPLLPFSFLECAYLQVHKHFGWVIFLLNNWPYSFYFFMFGSRYVIGESIVFHKRFFFIFWLSPILGTSSSFSSFGKWWCFVEGGRKRRRRKRTQMPSDQTSVFLFFFFWRLTLMLQKWYEKRGEN